MKQLGELELEKRKQLIALEEEYEVVDQEANDLDSK